MERASDTLASAVNDTVTGVAYVVKPRPGGWLRVIQQLVPPSQYMIGCIGSEYEELRYVPLGSGGCQCEIAAPGAYAGLPVPVALFHLKHHAN
jgi:hypothetical protein